MTRHRPNPDAPEGANHAFGIEMALRPELAH